MGWGLYSTTLTGLVGCTASCGVQAVKQGIRHTGIQTTACLSVCVMHMLQYLDLFYQFRSQYLVEMCSRIGIDLQFGDLGLQLLNIVLVGLMLDIGSILRIGIGTRRR